MSDPKNCKCDYNSSLKMKRDFLLSSLYVFDFLKDRQNFEEAQRILDNLGGCSDEICGDNNVKSDCGCGNIVF